MENLKILRFYNYQWLNYWFNYIIDFLRNNDLEYKVYKTNRMIIIDNIKLIFITKYEFEKAKRVIYNYKVFTNLELDLEKDFIKKIKEIMLDK